MNHIHSRQSLNLPIGVSHTIRRLHALLEHQLLVLTLQHNPGIDISTLLIDDLRDEVPFLGFEGLFDFALGGEKAWVVIGFEDGEVGFEAGVARIAIYVSLDR